MSVSTSPSPHGSVRVRSRVYFSTRSTRKKMKTVGNLRVKNNGDGYWPTDFKRQHVGSVTHSTLLHKIMRSKLVVLGE